MKPGGKGSCGQFASSAKTNQQTSDPAEMSASLLEIRELEDWLEHLSKCKPLEESQVRMLCEKVIHRIRIYVALYDVPV